MEDMLGDIHADEGRLHLEIACVSVERSTHLLYNRVQMLSPTQLQLARCRGKVNEVMKAIC
jgi:hypothetical protein